MATYFRWLRMGTRALEYVHSKERIMLVSSEINLVHYLAYLVEWTNANNQSRPQLTCSNIIE